MDDELTNTERAALDAWAPLKPPSGFAERVLVARPVAKPRSWRGVAIVGAMACMTAAAVIAVVFTMTPGAKPIATVTLSTGPLDRQPTGQIWESIVVGSEIVFGDAVRTGDGRAELQIAGGAKIAMQPHTLMRFGSRDGRTKISVELGSIDLSGDGTFGLDIGDVRIVRAGTVRITGGGDGKTEIKLVFGEAQVAALDGKTIDLTLGISVDVSIAIGPVALATLDAGAAEPADAAAVAVVATGDATITATGKKVEMVLPGETTWSAVPEGRADLPRGTKVRVGAGSTAALTSGATTLALGGGSRAQLTDTSMLDMEIGTGTLTTSDGSLALPGGAMAFKTRETAEARLETGGGGMKVTVTRGNGRLTGTGGSQLDMNRGESATLMRSGQIRPLEAIPTYFDMRIVAGDGNFTIHDPRPPTAVQFQFANKCADGGIIELDRDTRFRTAKVSAGKDFANHLVKGGTWHYRLRCTSGGADGSAVASGRIAVVADSGSRKLPVKPGASPFTPNGMGWKLGYQSVVPDLAVTFPGVGSSFVLHLARGGKDMTFLSSSPKLRIPGKDLSEGVYTYWFDRDGVKQDKTGALTIQFDQTAPQVYIELPVNGKAWTGDVDVKGAVLPGWTAAVDAVSIPIDGARRFAAKVGQPPGNALAIRLSHPQRGVHYYLRRGR